MFDNRSSRPNADIQDTLTGGHLAPAQPLADALRETLASFDHAYEQELERIRLGSSPPAVKDRALHRLQERHRARREPYVQQLAQMRSHAERST